MRVKEGSTQVDYILRRKRNAKEVSDYKVQYAVPGESAGRQYRLLLGKIN